MKRHIFSALCHMRGSILERRFYGKSGERWWHRLAVSCIDIPLDIIGCWNLRHLWYPNTWKIFNKKSG
jgi:hypothetical protein